MFDQAWETLATVDETQTGIVRDVLLYPTVGVWLVRALRTNDELGYLNCLAAATAIRAGLSSRVDVPVTNGVISIPTVGTAKASGAVTAIQTPELSIAPATRYKAEANGIQIDALIDDFDPYREFAEPVPPQRLSPDELADWHQLLDAAWDILTTRHEAYAHELSVGLSALYPIAAGRKVNGASSAAAFGGISLSAKDSAANLAEVLVHELQHSKLNAILELVSLQHKDSNRLWYAPWRPDPRPLAGLLHGIYAFTSVVEFWQIERDLLTDREDAQTANLTFALRRAQVREAINSVRSAPELTEHGQQLVDAADKRIAACEDEPVPAEVLRTVAYRTDEHRQRFSSELHRVSVTVGAQ